MIVLVYVMEVQPIFSEKLNYSCHHMTPQCSNEIQTKTEFLHLDLIPFHPTHYFPSFPLWQLLLPTGQKLNNTKSRLP